MMEYGLIGERLSHSFSATIHSMLFSYEYKLTELAPQELDHFLRRRDFRAVNVTIPYKEAVFPYLDEIDPIARECGAVNTVVNRGGRLFGYNTDLPGMSRMIEKSGITVKGKKVLVLGSGGTSKTAVATAKALDCGEVLRVSRTGRDGALTYEQAAAMHNDADVIVNTTPCGMFPNIGQSALDLSPYKKLSGVVDAVYNPLRSALVLDAEKRGITAVGGLYMLVAQAVFAAEHFKNTTLPEGIIDDVYGKILRSKQNIVLTGMPGAGKTTVGKLLSDKLGLEFVDTDEEIIKREGRPITAIFADVGEEGFRKIETEVISEVAKTQGKLISTGGGAILREENIDLLRANGRIYFLDRPLSQLTATADRPLSSDVGMLERRFAERYEKYCARCDVRIDNGTTALRAAEIIEKEITNETVSN